MPFQIRMEGSDLPDPRGLGGMAHVPPAGTGRSGAAGPASPDPVRERILGSREDVLSSEDWGGACVCALLRSSAPRCGRPRGRLAAAGGDFGVIRRNSRIPGQPLRVGRKERGDHPPRSLLRLRPPKPDGKPASRRPIGPERTSSGCRHPWSSRPGPPRPPSPS